MKERDRHSRALSLDSQGRKNKNGKKKLLFFALSQRKCVHICNSVQESSRAWARRQGMSWPSGYAMTSDRENGRVRRQRSCYDAVSIGDSVLG